MKQKRVEKKHPAAEARLVTQDTGPGQGLFLSLARVVSRGLKLGPTRALGGLTLKRRRRPGANPLRLCASVNRQAAQPQDFSGSNQRPVFPACKLSQH